ncbi:RNA-binding protein 38-like isoform X2 [Punica granatum]|uniref:RNA-binding protein 38-like isoform X2 n=1 Tax=Punica granatum TaxID=22663 RepID=A0A6P8C7N9_PUNGR|nr:RNA-binding protein 38-like isoform X2 [Punica granatum]
MAHQRIPGFQPVNPQSLGDTTFTKVFVGGLAWETRSDTLRRYFEQFGEVSDATVVTDKTTGRSKGYGFVTFRDPEAAKRACADPILLIDGRWANCNLASLGRPQLVPLYGHLKTANSYVGGLQIVQRNYAGSFLQPLPYGYYQQGHLYPPYGYATCGPKYLIPPEIHNPYAGQHYLPIYEASGAITPTMYQYERLGQTVASGHGYSLTQGFMMPGHNMMQFGGLGVDGLATSPIPMVQALYPSAAVSVQPQYLLSVPPVVFSDLAQIAG